MAVTKYLDKTGLTYFWSKIKTYITNMLTWSNISGKPSSFTPASHTHNKLVSAGDNVASTSTNTYAAGYFNVRWFSQTDKVPGQPSQYGFLATFATGDNMSEVHQLWCTQNNGDLYHRGTNGSSYTAPPVFKKIIDSSNETQLSLTTSGSGNAITALSVSNHTITATKGTTFLTSHQSLSNYVTLNSAQIISAVKTFTAKPVLNQVGLDMTVKDTNADTLRTYQVLYANSDNSGYGINIALGGSGNTVVGAGESHTAQLNDLAGNNGEDLYLVADGRIYFKTNGSTFSNAKTITLDNTAHLYGLTKVTATSFVGSLTGNVTGNCSGTSSNVTGTVAIANGGTGATTRLNAVKALTNEDVGANAQFFLTITSSWGKAGYTSVANAKTVLGLKSAAYTESSAYATSGHTHSYLPLSGGILTGSLTGTTFIYKSTNIDRADTTTDSSIENWVYAYRDKNNNDIGNYGVNRHPKNGNNRHKFRLRNTNNSFADLIFELKDNGQYFLWMTGSSGTTNGGFSGNITGNAATATKATQDGNGNTITSTYVAKAGDTMTGVLTVQNSNIKVKDTGITRASSTTAKYPFALQIVDNGNNTLGGIYFTYGSDKSTRTHLMCYKGTTASSSDWCYIGIGFNSSGNVFTYAPTPAANSNDTNIATTKWVKDRGYLTSQTQLSLTNSGSGNAVTGISVSNHAITVTKGSTFLTSHQSLANYVTLDSAQNITGAKRFVNSIGMDFAEDYYNHNPSTNVYRSLNVKEKTQKVTMADILYANNSGSSATWILRLGFSAAINSYFGVYESNSDSYCVTYFDLIPSSSGNVNCGRSSRKWNQVWATTGTIQTSDKRLKEDITDIPDNVLDVWEDVSWKQFKFKKSIKEKGNELARIHSGIIAQDVQELFDKVDIDCGKYGFFCYDEWDAEEARYDDDGNLLMPGIEADNQYSVRYEEALCIEAAYQRRKNKILENRISELENQLSSVLQTLQELKGVRS